MNLAVSALSSPNWMQMVAFFGPRKRVRTNVVAPLTPTDWESKLQPMAVPLLLQDIFRENVTSETTPNNFGFLTCSSPSSIHPETMFGL